MASQGQRQCAEEVKAVHRILREKVARGEDAGEVWREHLEDRDVLGRYANNMQSLAVEHWVNSEDNNRVEWVKAEVEEYYRGAGRRREEERDRRRARRAGKEQEQNSREVLETQEQNKVEELNKQEEQSRREEQKLLTVLDVGSCYNPFGGVEDWEVTAVDIAPANSRVYKMDFLGVKMGKETCLGGQEQAEVTQLGLESFHVVFFCLLLEYLPSPEAPSSEEGSGGAKGGWDPLYSHP